MKFSRFKMHQSFFKEIINISGNFKSIFATKFILRFLMKDPDSKDVTEYDNNFVKSISIYYSDNFGFINYNIRIDHFGLLDE